MIENFDYKHGESTENDIIDYILRLLTEYPGQPNAAVSVYCHIVGQPFDNTEMIDKVVEKLLKYDLAQTDLNIHGVVKIRPKGREVYRNGGFTKFLEAQQQIENQEKTNKPSSQIIIHGHVTGSQIGHESDFGNLESSHNSISREPIIITPEPSQDAKNIFKNKESIWSKIYKWTDHKLISMLIYGLIGFLLPRRLT
jgi:hypothetical protein